jgi:hypothetical protein
MLHSPDDSALAHAPVHAIACAGIIEEDEKLPDGRYHILLRGVARVRLEEELFATGKPYREFRADVLEDVYPVGGPSALASDAEALEQVVLELARRLPGDSGVPELAEAVARMRIPARMADLVAAAIIGDTSTRVRILEELDVASRLEIVIREVAALLLRVPGKGGPPGPSA